MFCKEKTVHRRKLHHSHYFCSAEANANSDQRDATTADRSRD